MALAEIQHIQRGPGFDAAIAGIRLVHMSTIGEVPVSDDTIQAAHNDAANILFPHFRSADEVVNAYRVVSRPSLSVVSRLVGDTTSLAKVVEEEEVPEVFTGIFLEEAGPQVAEAFSQVVAAEPEVPEGELETVRLMHRKWGEQFGFEEPTVFADTSTSVYEAQQEPEEESEEQRLDRFIAEVGIAFPQLITSGGIAKVQQKALASKMSGAYRIATWATEEGHVTPERVKTRLEFTFSDLVVLCIVSDARSRKLPVHKKEIASKRDVIEAKINDYIASRKEVN